jgi:hypothetical protein
VRLFTRDEADELLAEVRPLAEQLVERKRSLDEAEAARAALLGRIAGNGGDLAPSDVTDAIEGVRRAAAEVGRLVDELHELGVQVKDLDVGLLDFPSERHGEVVLLCWRVGEDEIGYWHGVDEGFAGRKPL